MDLLGDACWDVVYFMDVLGDACWDKVHSVDALDNLYWYSVQLLVHGTYNCDLI